MGEGGRVGLEVLGGAVEQIENGRRGEPGADERLVHPVARERVDESGRVADEQRPTLRRRSARTPKRQPVPAQALDLRLVDRVLSAELAQVLAQARPLALPAADADVDVVALREDPAVAAGDRAQLERGEPAVAM